MTPYLPLLVWILLVGHLAHCKPIRLLSSSTSSLPQSNVRVLSKCSPGMFIKRDCKYYIDCYKGYWRRNFCGPDKFWNQNARKCDHLINVPECYEQYRDIIESSNGKQAPVDNVASHSSTTTSTSTTIATVSTTTKSPVIEVTQASTTRAPVRASTLASTHITESTTAKTTRCNEGKQADTTKNSSGKDAEEDFEYDEEPDPDFDDVKSSDKCLENVIHDIAVDQPGNEITVEETPKQDDKKEEKLDLEKDKVRSASATQVSAPQKGFTPGRTCTVRGRQMECQDTEPTSTTEAPASSTVSSNVAPVESKSPCGKVQYTISVNLNMGKTMFDLVRAIAYYVNLTLYAWKTT